MRRKCTVGPARVLAVLLVSTLLLAGPGAVAHAEEAHLPATDGSADEQPGASQKVGENEEPSVPDTDDGTQQNGVEDGASTDLPPQTGGVTGPEDEGNAGPPDEPSTGPVSGAAASPAVFGDYHTNDVAVLNAVISEHPELEMSRFESTAAGPPQDWNAVVAWDNASPNRINGLDFQHTALEGELDLRELEALQALNCSDTSLVALDVGGLERLELLQCEFAQLETLNVSGCIGLTVLRCYENRLTELDVGGLTALNMLDCDENDLVSLNVDGCESLQTLWCYGNQLKSLDVGGLSALEFLNCEDNQLTALNLTGLVNLRNLNCSFNRLTALDVTEAVRLEGLYCVGNELRTLDVNGLESLVFLSCTGNELSRLDLSGLSALENLECYANRLTSLDLSDCDSLHQLDCSYNQLSDLKLTGRSNLFLLNCTGNRLTNLDLRGCDSLEVLVCSYNLLSNLDLRGLDNLWGVDCSVNQLTSLELGAAYGMEVLFCDVNRLESLDLSRLDALEHLECSYNYFPSEAAVVGIADVPYSVFEPQNDPGFVAAIAVFDLPTAATVGKPLTLSGSVYPANATNGRSVGWAISGMDPGFTAATVSGNTLTATEAGLVVVDALIENGRGHDIDLVYPFFVIARENGGDTGTARRSTGGTRNGGSNLPAPTATPLSLSGLPGTIRVGDSFTLTSSPDTGSGSVGWTWDRDYLSASFGSQATFTALREGTSVISYANWLGTATTSVEVSILAAQGTASTVSSVTGSSGGGINDNPQTGRAGSLPETLPALLSAVGVTSLSLAFLRRRHRRPERSHGGTVDHRQPEHQSSIPEEFQ